jgi:deazaflavin-dependent oxidoreductase (nitroreductase family)
LRASIRSSRFGSEDARFQSNGAPCRGIDRVLIANIAFFGKERATMDEQVRNALYKDRTIDITTTGRTSGQPRRIETWIHHIDDNFYMTGSPGHRDWLANLKANPRFTVHLKQSAQADLPATARPITDEQERRSVLTPILTRLGHLNDIDDWMARSPLVAVDFDGLAAS